MNRNRLLLTLGLASALTVLLGLVYLLHRADSKGVTVTDQESTHIDAKPPATAQKQLTQSTASAAAKASAKESALALLSSDDPDRWKKTIGRYFSQLDAPEIWALLNAPGVEQQNESKTLRQAIITACMVAVRELEVKGHIDSPKPSLLTDACTALHSNVDGKTLSDLSSQFGKDESYLTAPHTLLRPWLDPSKVEPSQLQAEEKLAQSALSQSSDPWLASAGLHSLWNLHSPDITDDWAEISALSKFQNQRLASVIGIDLECAMVGGDCGPTNPWVLKYCAMMPGTQCPPGSSFNDIVALNLSPVELELRRKVLANLARRYPH